MSAAARLGDNTSGICDLGLPDCPHSRSGTNGSGSQNVFINGIAAHRQGDTGPTNCPHGGTFASTGGSGSVFVNGRPLTRIGDSTSCGKCGKSGTHTSGSSDVFAG